MCHVRYSRLQINSALAIGSVAVEFDLYRSVDGHDRLPWLCLALVHMVHNIHVHVRTRHEL